MKKFLKTKTNYKISENLIFWGAKYENRKLWGKCEHLLFFLLFSRKSKDKNRKQDIHTNMKHSRAKKYII